MGCCRYLGYTVAGRWMNMSSSNETVIHIHSSTTYTTYSLVYAPNADPHTNSLKTLQQNRRTFLSSAPFSTLPAINPTWTYVGSTPGLCGDTSATNRLSHGTALLQAKSKLHFLSLFYRKLKSRKKVVWGSGGTAPGRKAQFPSARLPRGLNYVWRGA